MVSGILLASCSGSKTYLDREAKSWEQNSPPPGEDLVYRVFLIGDAGAPSLDRQEPVLKLFQSFLEQSGENSAAIFLGDNIYMKGLPDSTDPECPYFEARINEQLKTVENFKGRVVFIPGNHDWEDGGRGGLEAVRRQEKYIEAYLDRGNTFLPDDGFPGPHEIKLMDKDDDERLQRDIRFVALDTQWWLHRYDKVFGDNGEFEVSDAGDVITQLQDIVRDRKNDFLIVGAHHPIESNDRHAGYFPAKTHLMPPIGGTFYALYRKLFGYKQDLAHHRYRDMTRYFKEVFKEKEEIFYVSGHAHTLQYEAFTYANRYTQHYIISGAGSKAAFAADGRGQKFSHEGEGFMTLQIYANGTVWLEAWEPVGDGSRGNLLYRTQIKDPYGNVLEEDEEEIPDIDYTDSTVVVAPNSGYAKAGSMQRFFLGENHRDLWGIESEFPVFDVSEIEGGLTATRSGGRGQSNTLHLDGPDGKKYVLRSLDKVAGKVWDEHLRNSFALEIAQDQFSMLDPYSALIATELSKAAGIYYIEPTIYYVPDDPKLGVYGDQMAGSLALFQRKPDDDMSDTPSIGSPDEVINSVDLIRELHGDIDHRVDQEMFAKFRLFDMLIGDWDRHSDQWKWAAVEPDDKQGKIYQPIPVDRDVAFMQMNGLAFSLARLGPLFQYQNTEESYGNFKGLNYNSLGITRLFTNQISKEKWITLAEELQANVSDEAIERAVRKGYPEGAYLQNGEKLVQILKTRRDQLPEKASLYYDLISSVISVAGSNKRELFDIEVLSKDSLRVQVFKMSGSGNVRERYFDRTFAFQETREVRIYGMGGDDRFEISGQDRNNIRVRIVGGPGEDVILEQSPQSRRKMSVYDTKDDNDFTLGKGVRDWRSQHSFVNYYDYENEYEWNSVLAGFYFNYNHADGIYLGGGPKFVKYSFRRIPAQFHYVRGNLAPGTLSANLKYTGFWYKFSGNWDSNVEASALLPGSYKNFYGLGNETEKEERESINYYRAKLSQFDIEYRATLNINEVLSLDFGAGGSETRVRDVTGDNNVLTNPQLGINPSIFENQLYSKFITGFEWNTVDNSGNPMRGMKLQVEAKSHLGLNEFSKNHTNLSTIFQYYLSLRTKRQFTYAHRMGYNHIVGSFPFFAANSVGGISNLRGFHPSRFSGRSSIYTNEELRIELFDFYNYYAGGRIGIILFQDTGRVWTDGETSEIWHDGYGGGVWFDVFNQFLVNFMYGKSQKDYSIELRFGFMF